MKQVFVQPPHGSAFCECRINVHASDSCFAFILCMHFNLNYNRPITKQTKKGIIIVIIKVYIKDGTPNIAFLW